MLILYILIFHAYMCVYVCTYWYFILICMYMYVHTDISCLYVCIVHTDISYLYVCICMYILIFHAYMCFSFFFFLFLFVMRRRLWKSAFWILIPPWLFMRKSRYLSISFFYVFIVCVCVCARVRARAFVRVRAHLYTHTYIHVYCFHIYMYKQFLERRLPRRNRNGKLIQDTTRN
jgi:hypothetical protein